MGSPLKRHRFVSVLMGVALAVLALGWAGCHEPQAPPQGARSAEHCREEAQNAISGKPFRGADAEFVQSLRDLYECQVVAADDESICASFPAPLRDNCRAFHRFFHVARSHPNDTPWPPVLGNAIRIECENQFDGIPGSFCAALEAAISAQNPSLCPNSPRDAVPLCRALASSDPKLCGDADCAELALRLQVLARGGLRRLTEEGTARDRLHARAALDGTSVCLSLVEDHVRACRDGR